MQERFEEWIGGSPNADASTAVVPGRSTCLGDGELFAARPTEGVASIQFDATDRAAVVSEFDGGPVQADPRTVTSRGSVRIDQAATADRKLLVEGSDGADPAERMVAR